MRLTFSGAPSRIIVGFLLPAATSMLAAVDSAAVVVTSRSMQDTICAGERVIVSGVGMLRPFGSGGILRTTPTRGQIIVARERGDTLTSPTRQIIKRVIAIGGDRIHIRHGVVVVNDEAIVEPYVHPRTVATRPDTWPTQLTDSGPLYVTVPEGHYFLMGDNRGESVDSRVTGSVPGDEIVGVVLWIAHGAHRSGTCEQDAAPAQSSH